MSENITIEPNEINKNNSQRDIIASLFKQFFQEKEQKFEKLEKKIISDIQVIEVLKYDFVDMLKYGKK